MIDRSDLMDRMDGIPKKGKRPPQVEGKE